MTEKMQAWSVSAYGGPDRLKPVSRPIPRPGPGDILVAVRASAVTRADSMMRAGVPRFARAFLGLRRPRKDLIGTGFSGEVLAVGAAVTQFHVGDAVFGEAGLNFGANASHICVNAAGVVMKKPADLPHDMAAVMCDGPLTSWNFLCNIGALRPGERVLILGGSGSLGSAAIQIAKSLGAEVTATTSAGNRDLVAGLGADHVIDYRAASFAGAAMAYDMVYDTLGVASFAAVKPVLTPAGRYLCPVLRFRLLRAMLWSRLFGRQRAIFAATGLAPPEQLRPMLAALLDLYAAGRCAPVMDRRFAFGEIPAAHAYVDAGHKRGNIVVA